MQTHPLRGVLMVLAAAVLWGTTGTAQSLVPSDLSPYWVGTLRLGLAALFFLPWLWWNRRQAEGPRATPALPWRGILAAAACMCVYNLAFFAGVRITGVAVGTAVAIGSGPVWAGMLQALVSRRLPGMAWWLGTGVAVLGVLAMVLGQGKALAPSPLGVALCLLTGLSYAVYALLNKGLVDKAPAGPVTAAIFVCAAAMAWPITVAWAGWPRIGAPELAVVVWLGVMSTGVAYLLLSHALRHISGATAVALALAEPVTAFALAIAVVGERPGPMAFLGLLAVLAGLLAVIRTEVAAQA